MVAGLVAVHVLADEAGHVGGGAFAIVLGGLEEGVQVLQHGGFAAEAFDEALEVVGGQPGVLPGVAFAVVVGPVLGEEGVEGGAPAAGGGAAADKARGSVKVVAPAVAAPCEEAGIFNMPQGSGGMGDGGIGYGILHVVGAGFSEEIAGDVAVFFAEVLAPLVQHDGGFAGFVGFFAVKAGEVLDDGIGHCDDAGIAYHAVGLVPDEVPHGEFALLVEDAKHGVHDVGAALRVNHVIKGHGGPVGIPEREGGVGVAGGGVDVSVGSAITAVGVAEERGGNHRVVKGGVEDFAGTFVGGFDGYLGKGLVPAGAGGFTGRVKVCVFFPEGLGGAFFAHGGKGYFEKDFFTFACFEVEAAVVFGDFCTKRFGKDGIEELLLVCRPAAGMAPAAYSYAVNDVEAGVGGAVPATAVFEVKDNGGLAGSREGVAVQTHAVGGGELGHNAVAGERNAVVAGFGHLPAAVGIGPEAGRGIVFGSAAQGNRSGDGHDGNVKQVSDARSVQVCMAEADDRRVARVVAGRPVPFLRDAGRAQLDHAEGHAGSHENMAMASTANTGIYKRYRFRSLMSGACAKGADQG